MVALETESGLFAHRYGLLPRLMHKSFAEVASKRSMVSRSPKYSSVGELSFLGVGDNIRGTALGLVDTATGDGVANDEIARRGRAETSEGFAKLMGRGGSVSDSATSHPYTVGTGTGTSRSQLQPNDRYTDGQQYNEGGFGGHLQPVDQVRMVLGLVVPQAQGKAVPQKEPGQQVTIRNGTNGLTLRRITQRDLQKSLSLVARVERARMLRTSFGVMELHGEVTLKLFALRPLMSPHMLASKVLLAAGVQMAINPWNNELPDWRYGMGDSESSLQGYPPGGSNTQVSDYCLPRYSTSNGLSNMYMTVLVNVS
ncbi:hypothetical protein IMY05_C4509001000 [Salix suchowensis]|nr:hypothetical protein IMY05_C4509001000 [Salix suchowensis]